jgi:hypothetical protein
MPKKGRGFRQKSRKPISINTFARTTGTTDYTIKEIKQHFGNISELIRANQLSVENDDVDASDEEGDKVDNQVHGLIEKKKFKPHITSRECIDELHFRIQENNEDVVYDQGYHRRYHNRKFVVTKPPIQVVLQEIRTKPSTDKVVYVYDSNGVTPVFPNTYDNVFFLDFFRIKDTPDYDTSVLFRGRNDKDKEICDTFLCCKVSRRQCDEINGKKWRKAIWAFEKSLQYKPNLLRGSQRAGVCTRYCGAGYRKNPLDKSVGQYKYKKNCPPGLEKKIDEQIISITGEVEKRSSRLLRGLPDYSIYRQFKDISTLPTICPLGNATQLSIGANYWSPIHTDKDYFYTTLSCCTRSGERWNDILFYFVLPDYDLAVPMRPGDIIGFNPLLRHCVTNPRGDDALVFSAYVSDKTCLTHVAQGF